MQRWSVTAHTLVDLVEAFDGTVCVAEVFQVVANALQQAHHPDDDKWRRHGESPNLRLASKYDPIFP